MPCVATSIPKSRVSEPKVPSPVTTSLHFAPSTEKAADKRSCGSLDHTSSGGAEFRRRFPRFPRRPATAAIRWLTGPPLLELDRALTRARAARVSAGVARQLWLIVTS